MKGLSASGLADLAGVTAAEVERMVDLGILVVRDGTHPFLETDVQKVLLATACEQAGLPLEEIAAAIRAGRLSFAFLEGHQYRRWAIRSARTYRQVSQETGMSLELLGRALESAGFAWSAPDDPIREDELEVVPLLQLGLSSGVLDLAWITRVGRAYADGLRLAAKVEADAYHARFELPVLESGMGQQQAMELAAQPPAHVGVAAGPVVAQGGDYFGRTVNLAARIAARAGAGQVLVSQRVVETAPPRGVAFVEVGEAQLKGFARPVRLLEACRA